MQSIGPNLSSPCSFRSTRHLKTGILRHHDWRIYYDPKAHGVRSGRAFFDTTKTGETGKDVPRWAAHSGHGVIALAIEEDCRDLRHDCNTPQGSKWSKTMGIEVVRNALGEASWIGLGEGNVPPARGFGIVQRGLQISYRLCMSL